MKTMGLLGMLILTLIVTTSITAEASAVPDWDNIPNPSPVPQWYYVSPCQQPAGIGLHDWLGSLPWYGELEVGGWDCSQLSAYVEWMAENCGYNAVFTCRKGTNESRGHCWLTIEGKPYETIGLYWVNLDAADKGRYTADIWFQDIHEAFEYSGLAGPKTWGWWKTYPELITRGNND